MQFRMALVALVAVTAALPLPALEDEMGRQVGANDFSQSVVSQVKQDQAASDPIWTLIWRVGAGVAALATFGGLAWWWTRSNPRLGRIVASGGGLFRVLSRVQVDGSHQVVMLKAGERVLVIGAGARGLTTLSEITDKEEVARLCAGSAPAQEAAAVETSPAASVKLAAEKTPTIPQEAKPVPASTLGKGVAALRAEIAKLSNPLETV